MFKSTARLAVALLGTLAIGSAFAQTTYSDNFGGAKAQLEWIALGDACLTAGTETGTSSQSNPIIPACSTKNFNYPNDASNEGALLLTPAQNSRTGAILSNFTFPMSQGLQVTFTTYSFGSTSNGAPAYIGADGITFFLTDGTLENPPTETGATGGAMGYSCSVTNSIADGKKMDGIVGGYLGLGMDEYGNFLNNGDNSSDGALNTNAWGAPAGHGGNSWSNNVNDDPGDGSGRNYQPNRIGMRGAGSLTYAWLNQQDSHYYSYSLNKSDRFNRFKYACGHARYKKDGHWKNLKYDYKVIPGAYKALPKSQPLADVDAKKRADGWPVTYKVTISPKGVLNFSYSYNNGDFQPVLTNRDISDINGTPPDKFRFGFSAGTGGQNNVHEITCFQASPLQANSSAGSNTVTGKVTTDTQFFFASYSSDGWWGSLVAEPLVTKANGKLGIGTDANWDAKCVLTGGDCSTMGVDASGVTKKVTVQAPTDRNLLTSTALGNGNGTPLEWDKLDPDEQTALNVATGNPLDSTPGKNRLAWLRGDRSVEQLASGCTAADQANPPCDMRARQSVLGDIINSSPTFVGAPYAAELPDTFVDLTDSNATIPENDSSAVKYSQFVSNNVSRQNMVYVGGNDGFLHGFRAGKYDSGVFDTSTNDGRELLGYMPYDVLMKQITNLTAPLYEHAYLVDATPVAGNVFYNGKWHTWLVGGVGSQGQEIYALNITDPTSFTKADVIGDWDGSTTGLEHLGATVGTPVITRMHNGDWAFIFGSGLHKSDDGGTVDNGDTTAGVYIGLIDSDNGSITFKFLDTGVGSATSPNGIAYVSSMDLDGDHIADYLYAGDTQGNVWRFDVTKSDPVNWKVSTFGKATATPLFVAKDASDTRQPITTAIVPHLLHVGGQKYRVMLYFGTGQGTPKTLTHDAQYAAGKQTFYGLWDWDMDTWTDTTSSTMVFASSTGPITIDNDDLLEQQVVEQTSGSSSDGQVEGLRALSNQKAVCWAGDSTDTVSGTEKDYCNGTFNKYGWMFVLPGDGPDTGSNQGAGEQIIYNPVFTTGAVVVNTAIPPMVSAVQCNPGLQSGWTMAFNPETGGGFTEDYFADADGTFGEGNSTNSGAKLNGVGMVTTVKSGGGSDGGTQSTYLGTQTTSGGGKLVEVNPPSAGGQAVDQERVSWREVISN